MSSDNPPVFTVTPPETPLDLTVKRPDFDDDILYHASYAKHPERQMSLPSSLDYQYGQYVNRISYMTDPCDSTDGLTPHSSSDDLSSPSGAASRSAAASPTLYNNVSGYVDNGRLGEPSSFEGSVLPKKRKNLWRPYDSRTVCGEMDKIDGDSSDSASSSLSDQEFKTPQIDPVKKRKIHMMQYASGDGADKPTESDKFQSEQSLGDVSSHSNTNSQSSSPTKNEEAWSTPQASETSPGYFTHMAEELTKSQLSLLNGYPEARDKMISGLKKRDIFGWGLKLMKPSPEGNVNQHQPAPAVDLESSQDKSSQNVCQDGEKTYIELQTVRSNSASPPANDEVRKEQTPSSETLKSVFKSPKPYVCKSDASPSKVQQTNIKAAADEAGSKTDSNDANENEKENINNLSSNNGDGKVYIQTRDNVIKSYDETKNVPVKTKKGISLIDLVEEIEATARTKALEFEDEKARNARNKRVTALLEQCNHVKLQALDFLMANVLIQDREPQYKQKNEKVQKMLKGDKISSVNMLDVLELQVEMGLN